MNSERGMAMIAPLTQGRRAFLRAGLLGVAGAVIGSQMSGCAASSPRHAEAGTAQAPVATSATGSKVLLAYFSRAGENYYFGGSTRLTVGNTEVLAGMIGQRIQCDVHRIEVTDPYPDDYAATVERNVREQRADARPAIANAAVEAWLRRIGLLAG